MGWKKFEAGMRPCVENNKDGSEGLDLVGGKTLSLPECKNLCNNTQTCNAFAWRSSDNRCHIKSKPGACDDKPCQWNYPWGPDSHWNWYWKACEGQI